jgi:hypothetical protein
MFDLYIMRRTQIYLTEAQGRLLENRRRATGRTISHLIREAIDAAFASDRGPSRTEQLRIAARSAGAWKARIESGAEHVARIRTGRRLDRPASRR